jgi:hypothetical protein
VLGAVLVDHEGRQLRQHARLIGAAGQQSLLSQTLTKDVLLLASTPDVAERQQIANRIKEAAHRWQRSQDLLKQYDPLVGTSSSNSDEVLQLFAELDAPYQAMIKALRELTTQLKRSPAPHDISALTARILAHEQSYLRTMNEIALQYERESIARQNLRDRL